MEEIKLETKNGEVWTSSRDVADRFGKMRKNVNQSIVNLMAENSAVAKMFIATEYKSSRGRMEIEYLMNRDGFSLLAMGFTGRKALEWKLKYIEAFNEMESRLKSGVGVSEEERLKLQLFSKDAAEVAAAHNKLVEMEVKKATAPLIPKARFHDAISVSEDSINFGNFAAVFQNESKVSFGRNKIMEWCRDAGYLCSSPQLFNKPAQIMLQQKYMQYRESVDKYGRITYMPLLTGRGQIWLTRKLTEYIRKNN